MIKKSLSVLLAAILLICSCSVIAFAKTSEEADTHLQFKENGKFRILQITDIQDSVILRTPARKLLEAAIETCAPDLIVLTGDNISSSSHTKLSALLAINQFMYEFEMYGIPVAMTFGNHDDEDTTADKKYQLSVYEGYKCFVGCAGEDFGDTNLCTYYIPIYSSTDANKMVSNIWMVDSGTYNTENDLGGYAATTKAQIDWYKATSEKLERENGHKIPSLMFQHIVVPEIWDALEETTESGVPGVVSHAGKNYTLPADATGVLGETPCPPAYTNGQFDAVLERGDVMGMFFGHDHTNTYEIEYKGVKLSNTPGIGFNSYNSEDVGVRVIDLDENDPWSYQTTTISYFDFFDFDDDVARYLFKTESDTVSNATHFAAFFKLIFAWFISIFKK